MLTWLRDHILFLHAGDKHKARKLDVVAEDAALDNTIKQIEVLQVKANKLNNWMERVKHR